jgi:hypothetical protein
MKPVLFASLLLFAACDSPSTNSGPLTPTYDGVGKYGVGVHSFTWVDGSRATPS